MNAPLDPVSTPAVTVVIPTHNRAAELPRAVQTVLSQGVPVEVIVVDDASTDHTVQVAQALAAQHPQVRVVAFAQNRGGGHARNAGIDAAQAPWLAFLDSDDAWLPGKLQAQLKHLAACAAADPATAQVISFTNLVVDHADGQEPLPWNELPFDASTTARRYLLEQHQVIQTSTLLMPTAVARAVRFDGALRRHQDLDFVLRAESAGVRFLYLNECLVRYSADPLAVRVSRRENVAPSLAWLERATPYLSPREIGQFYLRHVYDVELKQAPRVAWGRAWRAARAGATTPGALCWRTAKLLVPAGLKARLKGLRHG
ncbi:glycosyltransferase family 2 protein [Roseateles sp. BYS87W]|uniref:Glycosyltransferase family 2 protein n=1 Tax=Pelomonas baiyunensis TaxID=3299026 RepID=A0ABW7H4F7_9BURK